MTQTNDSEGTANHERSAATLFAVLWAYATIADTLALLRPQDPTAMFAAGATVMASVYMLLKPSSLPRLCGFAFVSACQVLDRLPLTANHWVATLTINLTIVAAGLWVMLRVRDDGQPIVAAFRRYVPSVRVQIALVYLVAAFHKTNWDYLDPSISCASSMAGNVAGLFALPRTLGEGYPSIIGSLVMEYGIPILLLIPKTRLVGVGVALGFHFMLGFDAIVGVVAFSIDLYALFVLFVPAEMATAILRLEWLPRRRANRVMLIGGILALTAALTALASGPRPLEPSHLSLFSGSGKLPITWYGIVVRVMWHVQALLGIFVFASVMRPRLSALLAPVPKFAPSLSQRVLQVGFPAIVLLVGVSPYLGYKTVACFSMFSNLRTEGGISNHVLLGTARVSGLDSDLVDIVDSSSQSLLRLREEELRIEYFEFRRLGTGDSLLNRQVLAREINAEDYWVEYRRHGKTKRVSRAEDPDAEEFREPSWLASKFLAFRPVLKDDQAQRCAW